MVIVIGCLILPFFLFSEAAPGLTQQNPIKDASLNLQFIVSKRIFVDPESGDVNP